MIIDTHAHLMFSEFDGEVDAVIERANEAGVKRIINIGCGIDSSAKAIDMSGIYDCLFATVGLHPYDSADCSDELMGEWEKVISQNKKIVAVGEIGLDYFKAKAPKDVQAKAFRMQLDLAVKTGLPVVVHNRCSDEDCFNILSEYQNLRVVFHCYGSDLDFAKKVWDAGYITSFTGIITYPNAENLREVVEAAPLNSFMVETDCPYLAPQKNRGKRNEPSFVVDVVEEIARIKGLSVEDIERISTENAQRFFGF